MSRPCAAAARLDGKASEGLRAAATLWRRHRLSGVNIGDTGAESIRRPPYGAHGKKVRPRRARRPGSEEMVSGQPPCSPIKAARIGNEVEVGALAVDLI